jgi:hypothetical protein
MVLNFLFCEEYRSYNDINISFLTKHKLIGLFNHIQTTHSHSSDTTSIYIYQNQIFRKGRSGELSVELKIILKWDFMKYGVSVGRIGMVQDIIQ